MRGAWLVAGLVALPLVAPAAPPGFGPREYVRGTGAPVTVTESFPGCGAERAFRLRLENGPGGGPRVSSARVTVNGAEVLGERDFNQQVGALERTLRLPAENTLTVRLAGGPGGVVQLAITPVDPCLEVAITSPPPGAEVPAGPLLVRGTVRGAPEIGVTVNGAPAAVESETFGALVAMDGQVGELVAVATLPDGETVEARQVVVVDSTADSPIHVHASPPGGAAPLLVRFKMVSLVPFTQVMVSLTGAGIPDFQGPDLDDREFRYVTPGIHRALITTLDSTGKPQTAEVLVHVMDRPTVEARLRARWTAMKDALRQGDVGRALDAVATTARERYRELLDNLTVPLAQIDQILTEVSLVDVDEFQAECEMVRVDNGVSISHFVRFIRDVDGLWRISFF